MVSCEAVREPQGTRDGTSLSLSDTVDQGRDVKRAGKENQTRERKGEEEDALLRPRQDGAVIAGPRRQGLLGRCFFLDEVLHSMFLF